MVTFDRKEYLKNYQREWIKKNRLDWLKENGPCIKCGADENLEVDHVDRSNKITHRVWSWSLLRRKEELSKCQVLCKSCHLDKTIAEQTKPLIHTNGSGYRKGCRCDVCKADHARDWLDYKRRKSEASTV